MPQIWQLQKVHLFALSPHFSQNGEVIPVNINKFKTKLMKSCNDNHYNLQYQN